MVFVYRTIPILIALLFAGSTQAQPTGSLSEHLKIAPASIFAIQTFRPKHFLASPGIRQLPDELLEQLDLREIVRRLAVRVPLNLQATDRISFLYASLEQYPLVLIDTDLTIEQLLVDSGDKHPSWTAPTKAVNRLIFVS